MLGKFIKFWILFIFLSCQKSAIPPDQKDESWSFVVFSDIQQGYGVFSKLSENIGKIEPAPRYAFCCGDIMLRAANEAEWVSFGIAARPITEKMPLLIARGNHDGNDSASEVYLRQYGHLNAPFYYSRSEKNAFFIVLDTYERGNSGSIIGTQLSWLKHQLDSASMAPSIAHIFLFMHHPLYPQGLHQGENLGNADELHRIFLEHKKIRAVFSGHDHIFNKYVKNGMVYITTGGGGASLYHGYGGDYHHFVKFSFYDESSHIHIKTIDVFNETIEAFDL